MHAAARAIYTVKSDHFIANYYFPNVILLFKILFMVNGPS
jgi:hypothetical protein